MLLLYLPAVLGETASRSHHARLADLFHSLRTPHGGPSFISRTRLADIEREALRTLDQGSVRMHDEKSFESTCRWVLSQLNDPHATYLPPQRAEELNERYHGRIALGIRLRYIHRREPGSRWGWRRCALVNQVDSRSPAALAGVRVGDELLQVAFNSAWWWCSRDENKLLQHAAPARCRLLPLCLLPSCPGGPL